MEVGYFITAISRMVLRRVFNIFFLNMADGINGGVQVMKYILIIISVLVLSLLTKSV